MPETETETKTRTRRPTKAKQVEKTARSYFDAVSRRDVQGMAEHWHEDVVADFVPLRPLRGPGEYRAFFEEMFRAFPDCEFTVTRIVANAQVAAVEWRLTGTFTGGPFQGVEPNGRRLDLRGCDLLEIEGGKVVKNTAFYDQMQVARSIGLMPPQDSGAERAMKQAFNAVTKVRRVVQERSK